MGVRLRLRTRNARYDEPFDFRLDYKLWMLAQGSGNVEWSRECWAAPSYYSGQNLREMWPQ